MSTRVLPTTADFAPPPTVAALERWAAADRAARAGELARSALDCAKAGTVWGWRPAVALADGLKRTYDWILEAAA